MDGTLLHLEGRYGSPDALWGEVTYKVKCKSGKRYRQLELDVENAPPSVAHVLALDGFELGEVTSGRKGTLEFEISEEDEALFPAGFHEPAVGSVLRVGELMELLLDEVVKLTDLEAPIAGPGQLTGKVGYKVERLGEVLTREFQVKVEEAPKKSVHPVSIDGVQVGELEVDVEGEGKLKYSTKKPPAFPSDFPELRAGALVQVGELFRGPLADALAPELVGAAAGRGQPSSQPAGHDASEPRATGLAGWVEIAPGGVAGRDSPTTGEDGALAYNGLRHRLWLYGGKGDDDVNHSELWSFDLAARRWELIPPDGPQPPAREDHTLVLDGANDQLVLFGGEDGVTSSETWVFELGSRRWRDVTSPSAPALEGHVAIYDPRDQRMIVHGGMRRRDDERELEENLWALDLRRDTPGQGSWSKLTTHGRQPDARREHEGVYDERRHRMLIFGGRQRSNSSYLCDVWTLDLASATWQELETHGERPNPVRQTATGYDPDANELTVFGGEVLAYMAGHDKNAKEFPVNEIWVLELDSGTWTDRTPYPPAVYDHVGVFVPEYGSTLIYGGSSLHSGKEHSTWLLRNIVPAPDPSLDPSYGTR